MAINYNIPPMQNKDGVHAIFTHTGAGEYLVVYKAPSWDEWKPPRNLEYKSLDFYRTELEYYQEVRPVYAEVVGYFIEWFEKHANSFDYHHWSSLTDPSKSLAYLGEHDIPVCLLLSHATDNNYIVFCVVYLPHNEDGVHYLNISHIVAEAEGKKVRDGSINSTFLHQRGGKDVASYAKYLAAKFGCKFQYLS